MPPHYFVHARRFEGSLSAPDVNEFSSYETSSREQAEEWAQQKADAGWAAWMYDDQARQLLSATSPLRLLVEWGPGGERLPPPD